MSLSQFQWTSVNFPGNSRCHPKTALSHYILSCAKSPDFEPLTILSGLSKTSLASPDAIPKLH
ncbi:hypothetical protein [Aequorivita ciconiae]|uniref:hypothetical protein n=1 Tax=Aequorivita ciconiae TaxID=2494375 RepID=UPI0013E302FA|nr:hypothetical protein [Aequorivita sp. H23M31]